MVCNIKDSQDETLGGVFVIYGAAFLANYKNNETVEDILSVEIYGGNFLAEFVGGGDFEEKGYMMERCGQPSR